MTDKLTINTEKKLPIAIVEKPDGKQTAYLLSAIRFQFLDELAESPDVDIRWKFSDKRDEILKGSRIFDETDIREILIAKGYLEL